MIRYLKQLIVKFKNHQKWHKFIKSNRNMFPSETYLKYAPDSHFDGRKVLNIGCGRNVYRCSNVTNVDIVAGDHVNVVWDLSKTPLPFESNSYDFIIANHCLEHIPNWFECFKEMARIVKPGGKIEVWIPPCSSDSAFTYRDHINVIGQASFVGCGTSRRSGTNLLAAQELKEFNDFKRLNLVKVEERPISTWWTIIAPDFVTSWMTMHLRNIVSEEGYFFEKTEVSK